YENLSGKYHTQCENAETAMFPVWFLSYRNKDRVAYATVNGQTGKVVADLPVDIRKYLLGSLILAIPIFILLNMFFTIRPSAALTIVAFIALLSVILYAVEMKQIVTKDGYLDDKGLLESRRRKAAEHAGNADYEAAYTAEEKPEAKGKRVLERLKSRKVIEAIILIIFLGSFRTSFFEFFATAFLQGSETNISAVPTLIMLVAAALSATGIDCWKYSMTAWYLSLVLMVL
ncbi:MAG: hypothetical protein IIU91_06815, partial [Alistipes sp.]|nr:hypothetical protein [Alistipes sp.]